MRLKYSKLYTNGLNNKNRHSSRHYKIMLKIVRIFYGASDHVIKKWFLF